MGLDATHKLSGEGYDRGWPELVRMDEATRKLVDELQRKSGLPT